MSLSCNLLTVGVHALLTAETALWCAIAGQKLWLVAGLFASWFSRDVVMRCLAAILCLWSASVREYFPQSATTVQTLLLRGQWWCWGRRRLRSWRLRRRTTALTADVQLAADRGGDKRDRPRGLEEPPGFGAAATFLSLRAAGEHVAAGRSLVHPSGVTLAAMAVCTEQCSRVTIAPICR